MRAMSKFMLTETPTTHPAQHGPLGHHLNDTSRTGSSSAPTTDALPGPGLGGANSTAETMATDKDLNITSSQGEIIYWRNMLLLFVSFVVALKTFVAIVVAWYRTRTYYPARKFANTLVGILLAIDLIQTVVWAVGVNIAGAASGVGPWKPISVARADRLCFVDSALNFWLDPMIYFWHAAIAVFTWLWCVRQWDVEVLQRRIRPTLIGACLVSAAVTLLPIINRNMSLWPYSDCFVRSSWFHKGRPATGVVVDRWVIMPACWLVILVLNAYTIHHLRQQLRRAYTVVSIKRLQVRLLIVTVAFLVIWLLQSMPFYLGKRTFALELALNWTYTIGLLDSLIFGSPASGNCMGICLPLLRGATPSGVAQQPREQQLQERSQRASSLWETLVPHGEATPTRAGSTSLPSAGEPTAARRRREPPEPPQPVRASGGQGPRPPSALRPYHIFVTTFDVHYRYPSPSGRRAPVLPEEPCDTASLSSDFTAHTELGGGILGREPLLQRGLEAWIPSPARGGPEYHLYVIAVQRFRNLGCLKQMALEHLGGPARYVLAGAADIGDAVYGRSAVLVYARTVDVESGAFSVLTANQKAVALRGIRGGVKGLVGVAFRYYDTSFSAINAHLPATSVYRATPFTSPLEEREKHIAAMLHSLRVGPSHELWDGHLQYHHVILCGNLNFRLRITPGESFDCIHSSSQTCQAQYEAQHGAGGSGWDLSWRQGAGYSRLWTLRDPDDESVEREPDGWEAGIWGVGPACDETEATMAAQLSSAVYPSGRAACTGDAWRWVREKDVLTRCMAQGLLLEGFEEAPITFPPTFKWRIGASADDYTDRALLEGAYVTAYRHRGDPSLPLQWPPSYTDRILTRSLADVKHRLIVGAYDMCEEGLIAQSSDHRPVSLALTAVVDTSPLPTMDTDDLLSRQSAMRPPHSEAASNTASAMAMSAAQRHMPPRAGAEGTGRVSRPLALQAPPATSDRSFPMLMCLAFNKFRFDFIAPDTIGVGSFEALPALRRQEEGETRAAERAEREDWKEEEEAEGKEDSQQQGGGSGVPSQAAPTDVSLRSGTAGTGRAAGGAGSLRGRSGYPIVDHVLILVPMPCEDPLLSLRRVQAIGDSLTGQHLTAAAGGSSAAGAGGSRVLRATSCHSAADEGCDSASSQDRLEYLHNLFEMEWHPGFEERCRREESASSGEAGEEEEEAKAETILIQVLNLGPPRPMQHALIKFVGGRGEELGQGVFCIGDWRHAAGGPSPFSLCPAREQSGDEVESCASSARDSYASSYFTPSASVQAPGQPVAAGPTGVLAQRHCINLSVAGQHRGTVAFDLAVKAKMPAADRGRPQGAGERPR